MKNNKIHNRQIFFTKIINFVKDFPYKDNKFYKTLP